MQMDTSATQTSQVLLAVGPDMSKVLAVAAQPKATMSCV
jgi:hypothetical protein